MFLKYVIVKKEFLWIFKLWSETDYIFEIEIIELALVKTSTS